MEISDAVILLPALGFPGIAEFDSSENKYRVFVSMLLVIDEGRASWDELPSGERRRRIANELAMEDFNADTYICGHHGEFFRDLSWPTRDDLELLENEKSPPVGNSGFGFQGDADFKEKSAYEVAKKFRQGMVFWLSQSGFLRDYARRFYGAYIRRIGGSPDDPRFGNFKDFVIHREFILRLPSQSKDHTPRMYNLVCAHERAQLSQTSKTTVQIMLEMVREPFESEYIRPKRGVKRGKPHPFSIDASRNTSFLVAENQEKKEMPVALYHPIYVPPADRKYLKIAHLSDTHVNATWQALDYWSKVRKTEQNEKVSFATKDMPEKIRKIMTSKEFYSFRHWDNFNNPNDRFKDALVELGTTDEVDIIIITGDLVDHNVGFVLPEEETPEGPWFLGYLTHGLDRYLCNRNWLLFYRLLLRNYRKPIFTILGNHDYRLGIYGLLTRWPANQNFTYGLGIDVRDDEKENLDPREAKETILDDQEAALSLIYPNRLVTLNFVWDEPSRWLQSAQEAFLGVRTENANIDWYNIAINPALDYMFLYNAMCFLFLDWRKDEELAELPRAKSCLTAGQKKITEVFLCVSGKTGIGRIGIVSMHPTVFCKDPKDKSNFTYGSFANDRDWFVREVSFHLAHKTSPAVVLSGHAHKNETFSDYDAESAGHETKYFMTTTCAFRSRSGLPQDAAGYRLLSFNLGKGLGEEGKLKVETGLHELAIPSDEEIIPPNRLPIDHPLGKSEATPS